MKSIYGIEEVTSNRAMIIFLYNKIRFRINCFRNQLDSYKLKILSPETKFIINDLSDFTVKKKNKIFNT
jgi:hypothetical protein